MTTFVLVHGAWHGAWCWDALVAELAGRGHRAFGVDLPGDDPEAGCVAYASQVAEQIASLDDIVLVGHSLGGLTVPLVAVTRPVRRLVYLCALLPVPGHSLVDQLHAEPGIFQPGFGGALVRDELGRSSWPDPEAAIEAFYGDCPPGVAAAAAARLRPQGRPPNVEPCPLDALPTVPATSVVARDDAAIDPTWSRRAARERLGIDAHELPGGHSPMLSRPAALADLLVELADCSG